MESSGNSLAGGAFGFLLEAIATHNGAPATGLIALAGTVLGSRAVAAVAEERGRRASVALKAAERISGLTREQLDDLIADDPRTISLTIRLLQAAGNSGEESVLIMIGALAGAGYKEPDTAQRQETLLLAIEGLTAGHVNMLAVLEREQTGPAMRFEPPQIAAWLAESEDVVRMLGMGLLSRGLIETPFGGFGGGTVYELSELGREVIGTARELDKPSSGHA